jgi:hypothetical protein
MIDKFKIPHQLKKVAQINGYLPTLISYKILKFIKFDKVK